MPVVTFYLSQGSHTPEQGKHLLSAASELYSTVLETPLERVRAMILLIPESMAMVGGALCHAGTGYAPLFEFVVMQGRQFAQRQALAAGFTELLAGLPGVKGEQVRGRCIQVAPEDWFIAGVAASSVRADEVAARSGDNFPTGCR